MLKPGTIPKSEDLAHDPIPVTLTISMLVDLAPLLLFLLNCLQLHTFTNSSTQFRCTRPLQITSQVRKTRCPNLNS